MNSRTLLTCFLAVAAAALPIRAQEKKVDQPRPDDALEAIRQRTAAAELAARRRAAALYADELTLLKEKLEKDGNKLAAAKASAEILRVKAALDSNTGLQAILAGEAEKDPSDTAPGRRSFRLNMDRAERSTDYSFWSYPQSTATWPLPQHVSGNYKLTFIYQSNAASGGKIIIKAGETLLPLKVPPGEGKKTRVANLEAGPLKIPAGTPSLSLRVEELDSSANAVWNLVRILLEPVNQ